MIFRRRKLFSNYRVQQYRQRGFAMLLVMFVVMMAFIVGLTFLYTSSTTTSIAQTMNQHAQARQISESGALMMVRYMEQTLDWRTARDSGVWLNETAFLDGTLTVDTVYDADPQITSVAIDDWSFENSVTSMPNPILGPPMTATLGNWDLSRTALVVTGLTVPQIGTELSAYSSHGNNHVYVIFLASVDGSATISQTLADSLEPNTNYAFSVDVGRQLLGGALANVEMRVYAGGVLIASDADPTIYTLFTALGNPSVLIKSIIDPVHTEHVLRFSTDDTPPTGVVTLELHAKSLVGVLSSVTFDNMRFETETYGDATINVLGRYEQASHRISMTTKQAINLGQIDIVQWSEP